MLKKFDRGPWRVVMVGPVYADICSDDFTHDVTISVNGDFESMGQRLQYAQDLAETLNTVIELTTREGQ